MKCMVQHCISVSLKAVTFSGIQTCATFCFHVDGVICVVGKTAKVTVELSASSSTDATNMNITMVSIIHASIIQIRILYQYT